jgi:hypothetical protein
VSDEVVLGELSRNVDFAVLRRCTSFLGLELSAMSDEALLKDLVGVHV